MRKGASTLLLQMNIGLVVGCSKVLMLTAFLTHPRPWDRSLQSVGDLGCGAAKPVSFSLQTSLYSWPESSKKEDRGCGAIRLKKTVSSVVRRLLVLTRAPPD